MRILKIFLILIITIILTAFTQIGGVVFLISLYPFKYIRPYLKNKFSLYTFRLLHFLILYCIATFILVPLLAGPFGREPLPMFKSNHLQPLNFWTCFLNRHYVNKQLKKSVLAVASDMQKKYPETILNYLDANFPFWDGFPLLPHLSHRDGKKLDIAFCYQNATSLKATNECPSYIGYGVCESPLPGEVNTANTCLQRGYWQYSILTKIVSQRNKNNFLFDQNRTKYLMVLLSTQKEIATIFIEPHLKYRMALNSYKIRFHGCHAVRHDDHIHVELD